MFDIIRRPKDNLRFLDTVRREFDDFDRMFSNLSHFHGFPTIGGIGSPAFSPALQVVEKNDHYEASLELPGIDEKDVEVSVDEENVLTIRGEKKEEKKEERDDYCVSEICYGAFRREIPIPQSIDKDNIKASFSKGVLSITLPKIQQKEKERKKIEIKNT
jgi:HSP20 family protein